MPSAIDRFPEDEVRDDFVPREVYFSKDFAELEKERLWPYVWQIACRLEEIPKVGDFVTYDILDDSIIVARTAEDRIQAFHNVCPHRGNRLTEGCGHAEQFVCSFHGWRFRLDGSSSAIVDRADWANLIPREGLALKEVKTGTWAGFVFINMDPGCQPLEDFLAPVNHLTRKHEFEKLRYAWYRTIVMPVNWKLMLEAFNEFYHVQQTHSQMLVYTSDKSDSKTVGRHGGCGYVLEGTFPISRSPRLPPKEEADYRNLIFEYDAQLSRDLDAMHSPRARRAIARLRTEATPDTPPGEVLEMMGRFTVEEAMKEGSGWPEGITPEYMAEAGFDWHVFPNTILLHPMIEALLWYRSRPHPDDPEKCIFDVWSLERFAPGQEPPIKREFFEDWRDFEWPLIFQQDFENMTRVQKGMKSRGFEGLRTSPVQERAISGFHRTLRRFLKDPHADDDAVPKR